MYRPLQASDFTQMHSRMLGDSYPECYIPVREDTRTNIIGKDGKYVVIEGLMAWGHPSAYEFRVHNGNVYAVRRWEENPEFGN